MGRGAGQGRAGEGGTREGGRGGAQKHQERVGSLSLPPRRLRLWPRRI